MDCGPTCLQMIAKYYGRSYTLQFLRERSFITRLGVSMLGISDAAEYIGFRTMSIRCDFEQLVKEVPFPCILYWNQKHFVVCYGIEKKKSLLTKHAHYSVKIADPAGEKFKMDKEEFLKCWTTTKLNGKDVGMALLLIPTPDFYEREIEKDDRNKNLGFYLQYLRPYKSQFIQLIAGMAIGSIIAFTTPFLTKSIVDQGIGNNNLDFITLILIVQLLITFTLMCVDFLQSWISLYVNTQINISLISDFLSKLMKLPLRFFDTKNIGDILQRIGDHGRIESFLTGTSIGTLFSLVNFVVFAIIMAYYNLFILSIFLIGNTFYVV